MQTSHASDDDGRVEGLVIMFGLGAGTPTLAVRWTGLSPAARRLACRAMEAHQLVLGRTYAFREKRTAGSPMLKVKLIEKPGRKDKSRDDRSRPKERGCGEAD